MKKERTKPNLIANSTNFFTRRDLFRKAAAHKGFALCKNISGVHSEPIKEYALDNVLLARLEEKNIKRQNRPDCQNEIFTLVDKNPQEHIPGFKPSNYWNFKQRGNGEGGFDLRMTLSVGFELNVQKRGIVLTPLACGSYISAADVLPQFRIFKVLVEHDTKAPAVAKELAGSNGTIVVSWSELGLGGIRNVSTLFAEFARDNETIVQLSRNTQIFNPTPYPHYQQTSDELFVAEVAQPGVFNIWQAQLNEYRDCLVV